MRPEIRRDRRSVLFLDRIQPIVDKIGRGAVDGLARTTTETVIRERGRETGPADTCQLIPHIPGVRRDHTGIRTGRQIAVQIICLGPVRRRTRQSMRKVTVTK